MLHQVQTDEETRKGYVTVRWPFCLLHALEKFSFRRQYATPLSETTVYCLRLLC